MTQLDLLTAPCHETLTARVAHYFRQHPGEWLDVMEFARIAGLGGWRSRISDCRCDLKMPIEWRLLKWPDGRNRSQYRYQPKGREVAA